MRGWRGRAAMVIRQWRMLVLLRKKPQTLRGLAEALDVCERTVARDLDALGEIFPIVSESAEGGRGNRARYQLETMQEWPRHAVAPTRELRA